MKTNDPHIATATKLLRDAEATLSDVAEELARAGRFTGQSRVIEHTLLARDRVERLRAEIVSFVHRDRASRGLE